MFSFHYLYVFTSYRLVLWKRQCLLILMSNLEWWWRPRFFQLTAWVLLYKFLVVWRHIVLLDICLNWKLQSPGKNSRFYCSYICILVLSFFVSVAHWLVLSQVWDGTGEILHDWSLCLDCGTGGSWIGIPCAWMQVKKSDSYTQEIPCMFLHVNFSFQFIKPLNVNKWEYLLSFFSLPIIF